MLKNYFPLTSFLRALFGRKAVEPHLRQRSAPRALRALQSLQIHIFASALSAIGNFPK
jgi:hypothetical protein